MLTTFGVETAPTDFFPYIFATYYKQKSRSNASAFLFKVLLLIYFE